MNDILNLLAGECPELGLAGAEHAPVRARSTEATIVYRPNREEQNRRRNVGFNDFMRLSELDLMMELPAGLPVPETSLSAADRRMIQHLPEGCVEHTDAGVVRLLTKPLDVRLAIVTGRFWRRGLERAGRFAPYCARVLALTEEPRNLKESAIEADYWGIGLVVNTSREPRLVVPPEPFVQHRYTPAGWAFAEDIHQQITNHKEGVPAWHT